MDVIYAYPLAFAVSFLLVALKAFQQLSVFYNRWYWVPPVSYGLAACEVYLVAYMAAQGIGILIVFWIGSGAALGCLFSMWLHGKMRK